MRPRCIDTPRRTAPAKTRINDTHRRNTIHHERQHTLNPNPIPELAPQLKLLRLSGILDSLDERNRQAISAQLAYTDFLAMLIGDEVARRESKKFDMRLRRAQFRTTKTLEQFDFARLPKLNRALVHDLATGRYLHERAPVLLVGPSGIGKSHLAQALGHCAVRQGVDVIFTGCAALTQSLNAARATGTYDRKLAALARVLGRQLLRQLDQTTVEPLVSKLNRRKLLRRPRHHSNPQSNHQLVEDR